MNPTPKRLFPDPHACLHTEYFQTSIQFAVVALDCALNELEKVQKGSRKEYRKLHASDTEAHIRDALRFLVNLAVIHGIEPRFEPDSLEMEYFEG